MSNNQQLPWEQDAIIRHIQLVLQSYKHWTGNDLVNMSDSPEEIAQQIFEAPFALVSHGTEADPIFNYGNRKALTTWELSWEEFTKMPSRQSAEEVVQEERDRLLQETEAKGFSNFSGVRISSTGKRFHIKNGIIWNLVDEQNQYCGQAAIYSNTVWL
ncbi:MEKHLA domain-containing protein [Mastigocoleus sp. MO_188.B34]|uniref:MEKHLA domain-containing protein n=1 Tax=Mastigocoleus sp. MO_188.B34 TaxID=3036635 RepID=UPI0026240CC0|nr:MEKHLA domain-containing protein [Mastigocoleus sp. MO_188.B34]MDJ0693595.1 MEKHLA domain-containing protein [Mastigocoleus sp. MO_188.B34]